MTTKYNTERRVKRLELHESDILRVLLPKKNWLRVASLNIPEDTEIVSVFHDSYKRVFIYILHSKEFDEIPEGSVPPLLDVQLEVREMKFD